VTVWPVDPDVVVVVLPLLVVVVVVVPPVVVVTGHETDFALMTTPAPKLQVLALGAGTRVCVGMGAAGTTMTGTCDVTRTRLMVTGAGRAGRWMVTTFGAATAVLVFVAVGNSCANGLNAGAGAAVFGAAAIVVEASADAAGPPTTATTMTAATIRLREFAVQRWRVARASPRGGCDAGGRMLTHASALCSPHRTRVHTRVARVTC
jgi:hypothetical protein